LLAPVPQVHFLLAQIFLTKSELTSAADELHTYLQLLPNGENAELAHAQLTELEKKTDAAPAADKTTDKTNPQ
jgi:hypothetical protein